MRILQRKFGLLFFDNNDADYEMILNLFSRIRKVEKATFDVSEPEKIHHPIRLVFLRLKFSLEQDVAFGRLNWEGIFRADILGEDIGAYLWSNDQYKQTELDMTYLKMERLLGQDPQKEFWSP